MLKIEIPHRKRNLFYLFFSISYRLDYILIIGNAYWRGWIESLIWGQSFFKNWLVKILIWKLSLAKKYCFDVPKLKMQLLINKGSKLIKFNHISLIIKLKVCTIKLNIRN